MELPSDDINSTASVCSFLRNAQEVGVERTATVKYANN